jgi:hypothetical protein
MSETITRKHKRAAALNGAAPLAIAHAGHGIAELAQELADLQRLSVTMRNAEGPAEIARDRIAADDITTEAHAKACRSANHFEDVGRRSNGMANALEKLILTLEPTTPDETLSLALVLAGELGPLLSNHSDREEECRQIEDALRAIIRGLVSAGATSPLTATYFGRDDLVPWAEARSTASREAGPFLVEYDPAKGCLKKAGVVR